ncbi:MAG: ferritin family protein [Desulfobacteraceae bacterium]
MKSEEIFTQALEYEKKIRDLYLSAVEKIDDKRGKDLFKALADDEQSHVDFLEYSLDKLKNKDDVDITRLESKIPSVERLDENIQQMKDKIPRHMLGDVKRVLNSALNMETETSRFYRESYEKAEEGLIKEILKKFHEIEQRHVEVVRVELDFCSNNGHWFNFMEIDMEHG